jgi:hypothetical protein
MRLVTHTLVTWLMKMSLVLAMATLVSCADSGSPELDSPVIGLTVGTVEDGWQATLDLSEKCDELRVTLNGQSVSHLFKTYIVGPQKVRLAPDDGLGYGQNSLKVLAINKHGAYPARLDFQVPRSRPLASAGPDTPTRTHTLIELDSKATLGLSANQEFAWRLVRAPAGSQAVLLEESTPRSSFTPDLNGTYEIELTVRDPHTGAIGRDLATAWARPNYPPIGVGIDTLAPYNGGYAMVIGTNCTPEVNGCPPNDAPNQIQIYPYDPAYPVQLLILARETLEPLWHSSYAGNGGDAVNVVTAIQGQTTGQTQQGLANPIVILAALGVEGSGLIAGEFGTTLRSIIAPTNFTEVNGGSWLGLVLGTTGWSAIGVEIPSDATGPAGYLSANPEWPAGHQRGYLQYDSAKGRYNFVPGQYASFNTAAATSTTTNTMAINGTSYVSESLGDCAGGFQLVVLEASSLAAPYDGILPANQTFLTNCGSDTNDCGTDTHDGCAITQLANALNTVADQPLLVFLQSIGTPISASVTMQHLAASTLSPALEILGGIGDAFNKSMKAVATPGYALVGGGFLLADRPATAQWAYGLEASGAAPGGAAGQTVFLEGLLQRNQLWRYAPAAGASWLTQASALPLLVYQPTVPWPYGTSDYQATLACISNAMRLDPEDLSNCYTPDKDYLNVRFAYCNNDVDWSGLQNSIMASTCGTQQGFNSVIAQLLSETGVLATPGVSNIQTLNTAITQYQNLYTSQNTDDPTIGIAAQVNAVKQTLEEDFGYDSSLNVAGTWLGLVTDGLGVVAAAGDAVEASIPGMGVLASLGTLVADLLVDETGTSQLGPIIDTTAENLATDLSTRYNTAANALGYYEDMILSDSGKLGNSSQALPYFSQEVLPGVVNYMQKGVQRFAYGRMLGAVYQAYGLLPTDNNSPADTDQTTPPDGYGCPGEFGNDDPSFNVGSASENSSWIKFTYRDQIPALPTALYGAGPYPGGAPFDLVLGHEKGDGDSYQIPSDTMLRPIYELASGTGLGEWPVWFFRHNFTQVGFADCIPVN